MVKVIETNLSIGNYDEILDHQSRVIDVDSWDDYVNEIKNGVSVKRDDLFGTLHGFTLLSEMSINNLEYDNFHLICDVTKGTYKSKKLAYLLSIK